MSVRRLAQISFVAASFALVGCGGGDSSGDDTPGDDDVAGTPDAGGPSGGPDAGRSIDPGFDVPELTWSWIPVEGTACMNDTPTGMGLNINSSNPNLLIYMEGGGACFNAFTCSGVAHQSGFGERDMAVTAQELGSSGLFNRNDADNPFKDWNFVFLPYCTGDIFAGSNPDGFGGRNQVGYQNVGKYLEVLVPGFAGVTRVVFTGSSAGGFGAAYNYDRAAQAFGDVPVTLLDDSAPALGPETMTPCLQEQVRTVWNLDASIPADCEECNPDTGSLHNIPLHYAAKYPDRKFGVITGTRDGVMRIFLGWGHPSCSNPVVPMPERVYAEGVRIFRDEILASHSNFRAYTIDSAFHVWLLENPLGSTSVGSVKLTDWIRTLLDDDAPFDNVIP